MGARFVPNSFQYNGRVAWALIPSLVVLMGYGGKAFAGVLMVGCMVVYILDTVGYREGAFTAVWSLMGIANVTMLLQGLNTIGNASLALSMLLALLYGMTLFLTGVWATLQFKWLQLQYPAVCIAFEKLLICGSLPVAAMVIGWGLLEGVGPSEACWYLAVLLVAMYYLFAIPLRSSFHVKGQEKAAIGGRVPEETRVQSKGDGVISAALVVLLPAAFYIAVHFDSWLQLEHLWSILLLGSSPLLVLTLLPDGLWWLSDSQAAVSVIRKLVGAAAFMVFLAGFEGRVVFHAFSQYIPLHPPASYIFVTVALYGGGAILAAFLSGVVGDVSISSVPGMVFVFSCGVGSLALGLPLLVLPAPLVAAMGMGMFLESKSFKDYLIFSLGAMVTMCWFVWHHFWFLDIQLGHVPLRTLCVLCLISLGAALLLPGIVLCHIRSKALFRILLLTQAILLCLIEELLFGGVHEEDSGEMYPAYMVLATSAMGYFTTTWLQENDSLGVWTAWLLKCMFVSKISMLVLPQARLLPPVLLLALSITPPFVIYENQKKHKVARPRLAPATGIFLGAGVLVAVVLARFAIFDVVQWVVDGRPSESVLLGVLIMVAALGLMPLVNMFFSTASIVKRYVVMLLATGMLLLLLRPPLPIQGGAQCPKLPLGLCPRLWDERHVPMHEMDDMAIYGEGLGRREHWPLWMLVGAVVAGLFAATSSSDSSSNAIPRVTWALLSGSAVGGYIALEFFPTQYTLQLVVGGASLAVSLFMIMLRLPTASSPTVLPWIMALWLLSCPAALVVQIVSPLPPLPADAQRLFPDAQREVEDERQLNNWCAVLMVYAVHAVLMAFALKLKVSRVGQESEPPQRGAYGMRAGYGPKGSPFWGAMKTIAPAGMKGLQKTLLSLEGNSWVPTAGNLATSIAFLLSITLSSQLAPNPEIAIFFIAPILLLINYDPLVMYYMGDSHRYFPPVAAVSVCLTLFTLQNTLGGPDGGLAVAGFVFVAKHLLLLLFTLPNHLMFSWWLAKQAKVGSMGVLLCTPLTLLTLLGSDVAPLRVAAVCGIVMGLLQLAVMRHVRRLSNRLL